MKRLFVLVALLAGCTSPVVYSTHDLIKRELAGVQADHRAIGAKAIGAITERFSQQADAALDRALAGLDAAGLLTPGNAKKAFAANQAIRKAFAENIAKDVAVIAATVQKVDRVVYLLEALERHYASTSSILRLAGGVGLDLLQAQGRMTQPRAAQIAEILDIPVLTTQPRGD